MKNFPLTFSTFDMQNYEIIPVTVRKYLLTQVKVNRAKNVTLYVSILTCVKTFI